MTVEASPEAQMAPPRQSSPHTAAARNLAKGGAYRANRRLNCTVGEGRIEFQDGADVLTVVVGRCVPRDFRVGEVRRTGLPEECEPGLSVRLMGTSGQAIVSDLLTTYRSAAGLVPDALGVLENVQIARRRD
ncbi:hypothetical protein AB0D04_11555 [Streptomyces sp. NPDC048483]|uniref:hypothetical protein n=1 Tax=Streptomyces sp. NPDC048483 TaxID=3154927 RepID=UPI00341915D0